MILDGIVSAVLGLIRAIVDALPTGTWNPDVSAAAHMIGVVKGLDGYLPVHEGIAMFTFLIGLEVNGMVLAGIRFVKNLIPGESGGL
jgi:hypothetical protein